ncbi:MAG: type III-B CRISPR module RAMP protein Cmr1, partial [Methanosarcinales archaeon]
MYTVKIKTLTPIWTGDVDRECKKIKETGIIGSLRWWYEAIVRGYGGYACDPTNSDCNEKDHCDACELFGCTGWSRKFRIEVNEDTSIAPFLIVKPKSSRKQWFLGFLDQGGILGNLKFKIVADVETQNFLKFLLDFSSSWGIGSRTQVGFGIGKLAKKDYDLDRALNFVEKYFQIQDNITNLPNLKDFFFTRIKLKQISEKDIESILDGCIFKTMQDVNNNNPLSAKEFLEKLNDKYKTYYPTAPFVRSVLRRLISN